MQADYATRTVEVPERAVAYLIGKAGVAIKALVRPRGANPAGATASAALPTLECMRVPIIEPLEPCDKIISKGLEGPKSHGKASRNLTSTRSVGRAGGEHRVRGQGAGQGQGGEAGRRAMLPSPCVSRCRCG